MKRLRATAALAALVLIGGAACTPETDDTAQPVADLTEQDAVETEVEDSEVDLGDAIANTLDEANADYTVTAALGTVRSLAGPGPVALTQDVDGAADADQQGDGLPGAGSDALGHHDLADEVSGVVEFEGGSRQVTLALSDDEEIDVIVDGDNVFVELPDEAALDPAGTVGEGPVTGEPGETGEGATTEDHDWAQVSADELADGVGLRWRDVLIALHDPAAVLRSAQQAAAQAQPGGWEDADDSNGAHFVVTLDAGAVEDPFLAQLVEREGLEELEVHLWVDEGDERVTRVAYDLTGEVLDEPTAPGVDARPGDARDGESGVATEDDGTEAPAEQFQEGDGDQDPLGADAPSATVDQEGADATAEQQASDDDGVGGAQEPGAERQGAQQPGDQDDDGVGPTTGQQDGLQRQSPQQQGTGVEGFAVRVDLENFSGAQEVERPDDAEVTALDAEQVQSLLGAFRLLPAPVDPADDEPRAGMVEPRLPAGDHTQDDEATVPNGQAPPADDGAGVGAAGGGTTAGDGS
jgi:hypothetical protein